MAILGGFLAAGALVSLAGGRVLFYLDERSQAFRRCVFFVLGFTRRRADEVRSLLLTTIYCGSALLASLLFALAFGLPLASLVVFEWSHPFLAIVGAVAEISLANLLVDLGCRITGQGGRERFAELKEIPWMKGLEPLPVAARPAAAALGAVAEEVFFRGVLLLVLTERLAVAPLLAVAIVGALFTVQQLLQVKRPFQALVIGCGCAAISLIGGLLVVVTGGVVLAVLCHAGFVVFFIAPAAGAAATPKPVGTEAGAL